MLFPGLPYGDARLPGFMSKTIGDTGNSQLRLAIV
jgi:hypothetical protein